MPIESPKMTCYLMTIVSFTLSVTIFMILTVKMCIDLDLLEQVKVKRKHANRNPMHNLIFDINDNFSTCHHFQYIYCRNVHDPDVHLQNGSRSNVNISNPFIVNSNCTISVIVCEIITETIEILSTSIFDLETQGQGLEKQPRRLRCGCQIYSTTCH